MPLPQLREILGYAVVAGSVWLGWEVVRSPVADRAPPALALRLTPNSPEVLRRAAESEALAGRWDNARSLAAESLQRRPFNARSLRVLGLAEAKLGEPEQANEMLTLAGNWSLRDDPSHAWLVEYRLRSGDFVSAFAHADTLARRRPDLHPQLFDLFTTMALHDARSLGPLVKLVSANPPWRADYLAYLQLNGAAAPVLGGLAVALEETSTPLSPSELQQLYWRWIDQGRILGVRELRRRLNRPSAASLLLNGSFSEPGQDERYPFGWSLETGPGFNVQIVEADDGSEDSALRIEYNSFSTGFFVQQLMVLEPGDYLLTGMWRLQDGADASRMNWQVVCSGAGRTLTSAEQPEWTAQASEWKAFESRFSVPRQNCEAQWIRLVGVPADRRETTIEWFDDLRLRRIES